MLRDSVCAPDALSLPFIEQTNHSKEIPMPFRTLFDSMKHRRSGTPVRRTPRRPMGSRLRVEALEDRCLLSFSPAVTYPVGAFEVIAGDLNGDQTVDLMAGGKVLLGNPDGTFQPARDSGAVGIPTLADFNRDGRLDTVSRGSNGFDVQLGNGDGTFQPSQSYGYGPGAGAYGTEAMGDVNNDGNPDVVLGWNQVYVDEANPAVYFSDYADVFLGDGAGGLAFSSSIGPYYTTQNSSGYSSSLVLGDFNGDSRLDIVLASANSVEAYGVELLGNGDGTFSGGSSFGYYGLVLLAGDFNGDNRLDIARLGNVQLGNGDGTFQPPQTYSSPGAETLAAGDFSGDGRLDLVTAYHGTWDAATAQFVGGYVSVLLGNGNGTFQAARDFSPGDGPYSLAVADFNGDALTDLAVGLQSSGAIAVLLNDGNWPAVPSITINDVTVTEGNIATTSATFTVRLSTSYNQPVTVIYSTADGTASAGADYQTQSGTLTFAPGETTKIIAVPVNGDRLAEPNETFSVNLSSATNAAIADHQGQGTIVDDDPRVSINDVTMTEGNSGLTAFAFTVSLSVAYDVPVTVNYATANGTATAGSDYQTASGTLTIPAGQTSGTITILVTGDRLPEPNKTFFVNLSNLNYGVIAHGQGVGNIVDDEPRISISDVTKREGRKNTTLFTFTVTLSVAYDQAVTMSYTTANGTATTSDEDYVAKAGTLTFAPGETTKTITIEVKGDSKKEANETFYLDLFGNSSNSLCTKNRGLGTILNDD
jgi:Calx-beta domain/FG-GAP-like repeat